MQGTRHSCGRVLRQAGIALGIIWMSGSALAATPPREVVWEQPADRPRLGNYLGETGIPPEVITESFLAAHPDLRWRREGLHHFTNGRYAVALSAFQRAAEYGDKPAQAMIAEMYWTGTGVKADRPIGYAWMDLAAERLYANFLILREKYWEQLTPAEREEALRRGAGLLAKYGDDVAKPRLNDVLTRQRRSMTGGRTGGAVPQAVISFVGPEAVIPFSKLTGVPASAMQGEQFYAKKYWHPEQYWELQDQVWGAPPKGRVEIGQLEVIEDADASRGTEQGD